MCSPGSLSKVNVGYCACLWYYACQKKPLSDLDCLLCETMTAASSTDKIIWTANLILWGKDKSLLLEDINCFQARAWIFISFLFLIWVYKTDWIFIKTFTVKSQSISPWTQLKGLWSQQVVIWLNWTWRMQLSNSPMWEQTRLQGGLNSYLL